MVLKVAYCFTYFSLSDKVSYFIILVLGLSYLFPFKCTAAVFKNSEFTFTYLFHSMLTQSAGL